jgi:hypothetical protein
VAVWAARVAGAVHGFAWEQAPGTLVTATGTGFLLTVGASFGWLSFDPARKVIAVEAVAEEQAERLALRAAELDRAHADERHAREAVEGADGAVRGGVRPGPPPGRRRGHHGAADAPAAWRCGPCAGPPDGTRPGRGREAQSLWRTAPLASDGRHRVGTYPGAFASPALATGRSAIYI